MSFSTYPDYGDSAMEWADKLPGHWKAAHLRWLSTRYSGGTPDKARLDYWSDGTIPWLNSGAVNDPIVTAPSAYITEAAFANSSAKWIPKDALVMALAGQGKTKGTVAQLAFRTTCNQSMAAIVSNRELSARYLYWWLVTNYQNIRNMAGGDLRDGLNLELLGDISCPIPPHSEQISIVVFLDHETTKIDALVVEQERLIDLLKEKRQAVISHAVTKGLDPTTPMKDSGIEWLGEVPAHWVVAPLKYYVANRRGAIKTGPFGSQLTSEDMSSDSIKVYNQKSVIDCNFSGGESYISDNKFNELQSFEIFPGDVLITTRGTIGRAAIFPHGAERGILHPCLIRVQVDESRLLNTYLRQLIEDSYLLKIQISLYSNATTIEVIYSDTMASLLIPMPPLSEQMEISLFLKRHIAQADSLITEAQRAIDLLKERRSALISAAVTGKIDVRGFVAPSAEAVAA